MLSPAQIKAFEDDVKKFQDRPIESIPRTERGTTFGGINLNNAIRSNVGTGDVSCGGHSRPTCSECPIADDGVTDHGETWCNGDCVWDTITEICTVPPEKWCNMEGSVTASTCDECPVIDCESRDCELMPAFTMGASQTNCRYVLDNDSRSASLHLNYIIPDSISHPAWMFNKLDILEASSSSFYSLNGHRFGYAGFQVSSPENPFDGR